MSTLQDRGERARMAYTPLMRGDLSLEPGFAQPRLPEAATS
jgi:hypothetical protein